MSVKIDLIDSFLSGAFLTLLGYCLLGTCSEASGQSHWTFIVLLCSLQRIQVEAYIKGAMRC